MFKNRVLNIKSSTYNACVCVCVLYEIKRPLESFHKHIFFFFLLIVNYQTGAACVRHKFRNCASRQRENEYNNTIWSWELNAQRVLRNRRSLLYIYILLVFFSLAVFGRRLDYSENANPNDYSVYISIIYTRVYTFNTPPIYYV